MTPKIIRIDDHKSYHEIDGIRLIYVDGVLQGWYDPNKDNDK